MVEVVGRTGRTGWVGWVAGGLVVVVFGTVVVEVEVVVGRGGLVVDVVDVVDVVAGLATVVLVVVVEGRTRGLAVVVVVGRGSVVLVVPAGRWRWGRSGRSTVVLVVLVVGAGRGSRDGLGLGAGRTAAPVHADAGVALRMSTGLAFFGVAPVAGSTTGRPAPEVRSGTSGRVAPA